MAANPNNQLVPYRRRGAFLVTPVNRANELDWSSEDETRERNRIVNAVVQSNNGTLNDAYDYFPNAPVMRGGPPYGPPVMITPIVRAAGIPMRVMAIDHSYVNVFLATYAGRDVIIKGLPATARSEALVEHEVEMARKFAGIAVPYVTTQSCFNGNFIRVIFEYNRLSLNNIMIEQDNESNWTIPGQIFRCMMKFEEEHYLMRDTRLSNFRVSLGTLFATSLQGF